MPKALVPQFLTEDDKLTDFAKEDFVTAVKSILFNGSPAGGESGLLPPDLFPEIKPIEDDREKVLYANMERYDSDAESGTEKNPVPKFHEEMVPTYEKMLVSLNKEIGIPDLMPLGLFDPLHTAPSLGVPAEKIQEILSDIPTALPKATAVLTAFSNPATPAPTALGALGAALDMEPTDLPAPLAAMMLAQPPPTAPAATTAIQALLPQLPATPPVPSIPSPELFELELDNTTPEYPNTGLVYFQTQTFTAPVEALPKLASEMFDIAIGGFDPAKFIEALASPIVKKHTTKQEGNDDMERACKRVMAERSITAAATAQTALSLGPGIFSQSVYIATGGATEETLAKREKAARLGDAAKNDIPLHRAAIGLISPNAKRIGSDAMHSAGTGIKAESYQRIKEIGKTIINTDIALDGTELDDNYKGLIVMMVLFHETTMDPGVSNPSKEKNFLGLPYLLDAQIWGARDTNLNTSVMSMTAEQWHSSPVLVEGEYGRYAAGAGKELKQMQLLGKRGQWFYYEQFLMRVLSYAMYQNYEIKNSNARRMNGPAGAFNCIDENLRTRLLDKYEDQDNAFSEAPVSSWTKDKLQDKGWFKNPTERKKARSEYPMHNVYDLYGLHQGGQSGSGYAMWISQEKRIAFRIAQKAALMISGQSTAANPLAIYSADQGSNLNPKEGVENEISEHLQGYADAVGWDIKTTGINWNKVVFGLQEYTTSNGLRIASYDTGDNNKKNLVFPFYTGNSTDPKVQEKELAKLWRLGFRGGSTQEKDQIYPSRQDKINILQAKFVHRAKNPSAVPTFSPE